MSLGAKRFNEAREKNLEEYLHSIGCSNKGKSFNCPICKAKGKMYVKDNRAKCFKCDFKGSIIDLVEATQNLNSVEAVNYLLEGNLIKVDFEALRRKEADEKLKEQKIYHQLLANSTSLNNQGLDYLLKRGLNDVVSLLNTDDIEILSNSYKGLETVLYHFKRYKFILQKALIKGEDGKRYVRCYGHNEPILYYHLKDKPIVIVEGIEDGLSALMMGYNFISLNGVGNAKKVVENINKNLKWAENKKFLIATDLDKAGFEALEVLEVGLKDKVNIDLFYDYYDCTFEGIKDFNEYLILRGELMNDTSKSK